MPRRLNMNGEGKVPSIRGSHVHSPVQTSLATSLVSGPPSLPSRADLSQHPCSVVRQAGQAGWQGRRELSNRGQAGGHTGSRFSCYDVHCRFCSVASVLACSAICQLPRPGRPETRL